MHIYNIQTDKHGTKYGYNQEGEIKAACQYCSTWFTPKRRFNQRYCSSSCKTMASNQRNGLTTPVTLSNRDKTTNSALKNRIEKLEKKIEQLIESQNRNRQLDQKELLQKLENIGTDIRWAKYASVIHLIMGFLKALRDDTVDEQLLHNMKTQVNQNKELTELLKELQQVTDQDGKLAELLYGL